MHKTRKVDTEKGEQQSRAILHFILKQGVGKSIIFFIKFRSILLSVFCRLWVQLFFNTNFPIFLVDLNKSFNFFIIFYWTDSKDEDEEENDEEDEDVKSKDKSDKDSKNKKKRKKSKKKTKKVKILLVKDKDDDENEEPADKPSEKLCI